MTSLPNQIEVPSYTDRERTWVVDTPILKCDCPAQTDDCRHIRLVRALSPDHLHLLEHAVAGFLADYKTRVMCLEAFCTDYVRPENGFAIGQWEHALDFNPQYDELLCVSFHLHYGTERFTLVRDINTWHTHVPPTHHPKEVKNHYKRPNYEISDKPIKR